MAANTRSQGICNYGIDLVLLDYFTLSTSGQLTHWGRVTHICVSRLTITGSDNGLSPGRRQAIIWTNDEILLIGPLGTNFSENLIEIRTFSFTKMRLTVSSAKWRPFCLDLNELRTHICEFIFFKESQRFKIMNFLTGPYDAWAMIVMGSRAVLMGHISRDLNLTPLVNSFNFLSSTALGKK